MPESKAKIMRHCIVCGKPFLAKNVNSVHCSKKCSDETYRNKRRAEKRERERQAIVENIDDKDFLTVVQVYNRYNVSRPTLYYSSGYSFRAESYLKQGKYLEAIDDIMKSLSIDNDARAHHYLFEFPDNQLTLVITKLRGRSVKNPHDAEWQYYIAQLYQSKKKYNEAIEAARKAFDIDAHPVFLEMIAACHQELGEYAQALEAITQAQQMRPDDLDLISSKADILGESGDIAGAITEWTNYSVSLFSVDSVQLRLTIPARS